MEVKAKRTADDLRVTLTARQHEFISDAETKDGGTDTGPTPHELLGAALAACTSMTVQMYANRKEWPLNSCDVSVTITSEGNSKTLFDVQVSFRGGLDIDQRKRLLEIANRCPVHRELVRPIEIRVSGNDLSLKRTSQTFQTFTTSPEHLRCTLTDWRSHTMKTIAFNGSNKNLTRTLFVLAALGGLYYMRRQGKSVSSLLTAGTSGFQAARGFIGRVAPSVMTGRQSDSVATSAQI